MGRSPQDLDELVDAEAAPVWRLIVRLVGNDGPDAADCFQQAFADLASHQRDARDVRRASALLKRIATARAIDLVRRRIRERKRRRNIDCQQVAECPEFEPECMAEAAELLAEFRAALAQLPERQAAAFVLTQIEQLAHDEAALALGVTAKHVSVLLHRARASLQKQMEVHKPVRRSQL